MDNSSNASKTGHMIATWHKAGRVAFLILYLAVVIIILALYDVARLQSFIDQHQELAFITGILAVIISALAFIPTTPITIFVALFLEPFQAAVITGLGTTFSSLIQYQLGKQVGDVLNFAEKRTRLPFKLGRLPVGSPLFLLIVRFLPAGPVGLNFVCGAYHISLFLFLWTALATNLIASALLAYGALGFIRL